MWNIEDLSTNKFKNLFSKVLCPYSAIPGNGQTCVKSLGCWHDTYDRAIDGGDRGQYTLANCQKFAETSGWTVFAMQNEKECFTAINARDTYQKHGKSEVCGEDGLGGGGAQNVYEIVSNQVQCKTGIKAIRETFHFNYFQILCIYLKIPNTSKLFNISG